MKSIPRFLSFSLTGGLSTVILMAVYYWLNKRMDYQYAYCISYSLSILTLYFMNVLFVFKEPLRLKSFLLFPLIYLVQYLLGALSLQFIIHAGFPVEIAPLAVVVALFPATFVFNLLVFKGSK